MRLRGFLWGFVGAVLGLVLAALIAIFAFLTWPDRFLTTAVISRAARAFGASFHPSWTRLDLHIRSLSLTEKEISFQARDLCFSEPAGELKGCFKSVDALFSISLSPKGVRIEKVTRFAVAAERIVLDSTKQPKTAPKPGKSRSEQVPPFLSEMRLERVLCRFPDVEIIEKGARNQARVSLDIDATRSIPARASVSWIRRSLNPGKATGGALASDPVYRATMKMRSDFIGLRNFTFADIDADLRGGALGAHLEARGEAEHKSVRVRLNARGRAGSMRFQGQAYGVETPERYALNGKFAVLPSSGPLRAVSASSFSLLAVQEKGSLTPQSVRLTARLEAVLASIQGAGKLRTPATIAAQATLAARWAPRSRLKDAFQAELEMKLEPAEDWYRYGGEVHVTADGRLSSLPSVRLHQDVDLTLEIPHFERLVSALTGTELAVPAPLCALRGPMRLSMRSSGDPLKDNPRIEYAFSSDLDGDKQKLYVAADGSITVVRPLEPSRLLVDRTTIRMKEVALQLPYLDPIRLPVFKLDSRIVSPGAKKPGKEKPSKPALPLTVEVRVITEKDIELFSNLAKTPVPLSLNLRLSQPPAVFQGRVSAARFDAEVFRRKATIDHARLLWRPDSTVADLDALVLYNADEAKIRIHISGNMDKPNVVLDSEPPLSQSDILGLLLYGKSPDELDPDQQSTVSNTQTAMADSAFGIASLYVFASTPIEYVGYDPASRSYNMKFRLPGGASLQLGGSPADEAKTVQLRKRLAAHFAIEAQAQQTVQGNSVATLLEWFNRY